MPKHFIYPIYTAIIGLIAITVVPKKDIRRLAYFAILCGGVFDTLIILVVTHLLKIGGYINFGPFGILGIPFFPPIAWTIYFVLYFYTIPQTKPWVYIFPVISAMYSVLFSNVLANLGIFKWNYGQVIVPFLIYLTWHFLNTFAYIRLFEPDNELANSSTHGRMAFKPALLKKIYYKRK
ncbi:hypothetical protein Tfer_0251 [Thermincola ferriacetica]|uniref:Uncharacterized protein n=1 Tax=Thermincola ferriacetica TaxID=281456 RepID=A0A0L6W715_9FIRM|nr:hypothetical protein [Thermincola ferriacetica]KNZ71173.1 hypothetical protein Tfer_0251 [Thermincola ferriacetica]